MSGENERAATGVDGLDTILGGGLFPGAIYIISGRPGAGKTILANQICFAHVRAGGKAVFATLLAETHERLLSQLRVLSFFDEHIVGRALTYLNALESITDNGLRGLLDLVRRMVRAQGASLLVLDGMVTAERLAKSEAEYKAFISELQTWVGMVGCTVIFVASSGMGSTTSPEHTMVDGIIELTSEVVRMRNLRTIAITKLRGGAFLEGAHSYLITDSGLRVFPRMESRRPADGDAASDVRVATGVKGLDAVLHGGLMSCSTTLLLGSSGAGKTVMGSQFLAEGARNGEKCLHFGFYEPPQNLVAKADRLGLEFTRLIDEGNLYIQWFRPAEVHIDGLVALLLRIIDENQVKRLFIDGFVGFRSTHPIERISAVFSAVSDELVARGVTTIISDEMRELIVERVEVPTQNVSAIFHNILFVRHVETADGELQRALSVFKTRDSDADHRQWRYRITDRGAELVAPLSAGAASLTAIPKTTRTAKPRKPKKATARGRKR